MIFGLSGFGVCHRVCGAKKCGAWGVEGFPVLGLVELWCFWGFKVCWGLLGFVMFSALGCLGLCVFGWFLVFWGLLGFGVLSALKRDG